MRASKVRRQVSATKMARQCPKTRKPVFYRAPRPEIKKLRFELEPLKNVFTFNKTNQQEKRGSEQFPSPKKGGAPEGAGQVLVGAFVGLFEVGRSPGRRFQDDPQEVPRWPKMAPSWPQENSGWISVDRSTPVLVQPYTIHIYTPKKHRRHSNLLSPCTRSCSWSKSCSCARRSGAPLIHQELLHRKLLLPRQVLLFQQELLQERLIRFSLCAAAAAA